MREGLNHLYDSVTHKVTNVKEEGSELSFGAIVAAFILLLLVSAFGEVVTYTYDDAGRLILENRNGTVVRYVYDKAGNLIQKKLQNNLTVTKAGTGSGTVTSSPTGINCSSICSAAYDVGSSVTLTASPSTNSLFAGWSGGCSGTGPCVVTMTAAKSITATFNQYITVTLPNGGESWARNTAQTIKWTYAGNPGSFVKIELLKGGLVNSTITKSTSMESNGSGSYSWKIPKNQAIGSDYQIRISSTSNSNYTDTSNRNFTVN